MSEAGPADAKTFDLLRAAWQAFTSFLEAGGSGASPPKILMDVFPPGGARTFVDILVESVIPIVLSQLDMVSFVKIPSFGALQ